MATTATGGRRALGRAALLALAGFVLTLGAVVLSNASSPAIVTNEAAPLLVAPYGAAASESSLPAGTLVLTDRSYDGYVKVRGARRSLRLAPASQPRSAIAVSGG